MFGTLPACALRKVEKRGQCWIKAGSRDMLSRRGDRSWPARRSHLLSCNRTWESNGISFDVVCTDLHSTNWARQLRRVCGDLILPWGGGVPRCPGAHGRCSRYV